MSLAAKRAPLRLSRQLLWPSSQVAATAAAAKITARLAAAS